MVGAALFSLWWVKVSYLTDFASFYRAAFILHNHIGSVTDIYRIDDLDVSQYGIPENEHFIEYRYSMFATYLLSPLGHFTYDTANAMMVFLNIVLYVISVILVLLNRGARGRRFVYPLAFSLIWMPFLQNIRWGQINAILLFLTTVAVILASRERLYLSGVFLAVASLFKPLLLAVTLVLSLKNWRILVGYVIFMILALSMLPGTREWVNAFFWPPHLYFCYSAPFRYLGGLGTQYFWIYAVTIGLLTALITVRCRHLDYFTATAFALPAACLASPVLEISYPTVLIFTFAYLVTGKISTLTTILAASSFLMIFAGSSSTETGLIMYLGIGLLWLAMGTTMLDKCRRSQLRSNCW